MQYQLVVRGHDNRLCVRYRVCGALQLLVCCALQLLVPCQHQHVSYYPRDHYHYCDNYLYHCPLRGLRRYKKRYEQCSYRDRRQYYHNWLFSQYSDQLEYCHKHHGTHCKVHLEGPCSSPGPFSLCSAEKKRNKRGKQCRRTSSIYAPGKGRRQLSSFARWPA